MSDVTRLLDAAAAGDPRAAAELLPLVYDELRQLAAQRLAGEKPGQTLQATALVHEAYLRLVGPVGDRSFANRRHFFAAAAQAMRHILVESARRKATDKHGAGRARHDAEVADLAAPEQAEEVLEVHEALDGLAAVDPQAAELVGLRYFTGLSIPEAAEVLGIGARSADRLWAFARAWLRAPSAIPPADHPAREFVREKSWRDFARDRACGVGGRSISRPPPAPGLHGRGVRRRQTPAEPGPMSRTRTHRLALETLEARTVPAAQLTAALDLTHHVLRIEGTDGADNFSLRHEDDRLSIAGLQITVTGVDAGGAVVDSVPDEAVNSVVIETLDGNDAISVQGLAAGTALSMNAGLGSDQMGFTEFSDGRQMSFDGGTGFTDYLYFHDARPGPNTYTVTDTAVTGNGLSLPYARVNTLLVFSINATPDTYDVLSTAPGTNLHLWGYWGDDAFRVGGPSGADAIRGNVYVWGGDGTNTLTLDNTGGSAGRFEIGETQTVLPSGAMIDYGAGIESMALRGGAANETFALVNPPTRAVPGGVDAPIRTPIPFTLDGGGGSNTLEYAEAAGLVAWFAGEGNAVDSAGDHAGFVFNGVTAAEGAVGQALQFNAYGDYVQVPNAPDLESPTVSVEAWVNATAPGPNRYIISKGADAFRAASYGLYTGPARGLRFYIADTATYVESPDAGAGLWDGNWHHVVGTFDGKAVRLFVDGAEVGFGTFTDVRINYSMGQTQDLFLGNYGFGAGSVPQFAFNGRIDEASVYDRALTAPQVQALYFGGKTGIGTAPVAVDLTNGTATGLTGIANIQNVTGGRGDDSLVGNAAGNRLAGGAGDDVLAGVDGDDVLDGGAGSDLLVGGFGNDTFSFAGAGAPETDRVSERKAQGFDALDFSRVPLLTGSITVNLNVPSTLATHYNRQVRMSIGLLSTAIEAAVGGPAADTMIAHVLGARLDGGPGADAISGGAGPDTLLGGLGNDTIDGGDGNDLLRGGRGDDWIRGGTGNDRIYGGDGNDKMEGQDGDDRLFGGDPDDFLIFGVDGNDTLLGGNGADVLKGEFGHDRLEGGSGFDTYGGGDGNDYLLELFPDTANRLDGGDGDDYIDASIGGSSAPQTLTGGAGNDTIYGNNGNDTIDGGDGNDTIAAAGGNDTVNGGAGNDRIFGGLQGAGRNGSDDNDSLLGGAGDDYIDGGHNDSLFVTGAYRDTIVGGAGNDILYGGHGNDRMGGNAGNDIMYGGDGEDTMFGGSGDDILYPGRGSDTVDASPGNDIIRDFTEITNLSTYTGTTAEALNPGSLVTIFGDGLPVNVAVQFGGSNKNVAASARATEVFVAPDRKSITARLPRGAVSGTLWVIDTLGTATEKDDIWIDAPGWFEVQSFRNTEAFSFRNFGFQVSVPIVQEAFGTNQTNITFPNPSPFGPGTIVTPVPTPQALLFTAVSALAFNDKGARFGMALLSRHLVAHPEWITTELGLPFGAAPNAWNLTDSGELRALIERTHQHQLSQEVINHTIAWKAADLLGLHTKTSIYNQLKALLQSGDRPLLSFQNAIGEGHVVVAYDLEWATSNQNPDAGFYIHVYDPNRPQMASDDPNTNGTNLTNSRIYIGSEGLSPGNEWLFNMANKGMWAGGFGDFMIIPYSTFPVGRAPTFPGTLPSLSDLILGTQAAPAPTGDTGVLSAVHSIPTVPTVVTVLDPVPAVGTTGAVNADRRAVLWLAPTSDTARAPASVPESTDRPDARAWEQPQSAGAREAGALYLPADEAPRASAEADDWDWADELDPARLAVWVG